MTIPGDKFYVNAAEPGSLGGLNKLHHHSTKKLSNLKKKLQNIEAYTLHKPARKIFKRRQYIAGSLKTHFSADLLDVSNIHKSNSYYKYLLTVICVLSRFAYVRPLKNKTGIQVANAFDDIFKSDTIPKTISTDRGKEFKNFHVQSLFKKYNIHHYSNYNYTFKESLIERFNRTLQNKIRRYLTSIGSNRYINKLDELVHSYNNTYHSTIKRAPASVNKFNTYKVLHDIYSKNDLEPKHSNLKIGDVVKISLKKKVFDKEYKYNYTKNNFIITKINKTNPLTFKVKDLQGNHLKGSFYEEELQEVKSHYKIKKILYKKKIDNQLYYRVKWQGFSSKYNTYVSSKDLQNYI